MNILDTVEIDWEIGDEVKWFDTIGKSVEKVFSNVANYGKIVKLTAKFADVYDTRLEKVVRVKKTNLNWD